MKRTFLFLLLLSFMTVTTACEIQQSVDTVSLSGAYATDVDENGVTFNLSVTPLDENGDFISLNVTEDDFRFEDVKVYEIEDPTDEGDYYTDADVTVKRIDIEEVSDSARMVGAIVIDSSGSMEDNDPDRVRVEAAKSFIDAMGDNDLLCVYDFGSSEEDVRLLQDFTNDKEELYDAVDEVEAVGGTPLYQALVEAANHLKAFKDEQGQSGDRYFIIVITDGQSTDANYTLDDAVDAAKEVPLPIFAVGLGSGVDIDSLSTLAYETGGSYMQADEAQQLIQLFQAQAIATSKGYIVVVGEGTFNDPIESGSLYRLKGKLITSLGGNEVPTYFNVIFQY